MQSERCISIAKPAPVSRGAFLLARGGGREYEQSWAMTTCNVVAVYRTELDTLQRGISGGTEYAEVAEASDGAGWCVGHAVSPARPGRGDVLCCYPWSHGGSVPPPTPNRPAWQWF